MKRLLFSRLMFFCVTVLACLSTNLVAQPGKIPFHKEPYFVDSGLHDGLTGLGAETFAAFHELIQVPGAPWLRLHFEAYNLDPTYGS